jgi:hypothetical protein
VPKGWIVAAAEDRGELRRVRRAHRGRDAGYIARAPSGVDETGVYTFGPVEASDDGEERMVLEGTDTTVLLVGANT